MSGKHLQPHGTRFALANCKAFCTMGSMVVSMFPDFVTVAEAAKMLNRSHAQVTRYIKSGLIPADRQGNQLFIRRSSLAGFEPPPRGNPAFRDQSAK
jgi:hypothetical protein